MTIHQDITTPLKSFVNQEGYLKLTERDGHEVLELTQNKAEEVSITRLKRHFEYTTPGSLGERVSHAPLQEVQELAKFAHDAQQPYETEYRELEKQNWFEKALSSGNHEDKLARNAKLYQCFGAIAKSACKRYWDFQPKALKNPEIKVIGAPRYEAVGILYDKKIHGDRAMRANHFKLII